MKKLPFIAVTMGDPSGIGPEIILKTLQRKDIYKVCRPLVIGDEGVLAATSKKTGPVSLNPISTLSDAAGKPGIIDIIAVSHLKADSFTPGKPTLSGGKAMVDYIVKATDLSKEGRVSAMVTCPISKELMHTAGCKFDGHTELLAYLTGTKDYVMMLAGDRLRVSLVTIHRALKEVPGMLNKKLILKVIKITCNALERDFGIGKPHIGVAALNPHAGEAGIIGKEDSRIIRPAVEEARKSGLPVDGPFPADTVFYQALNGRFDAVVAMYHDQGLIPLKLVHFSDAVNVTLGLPIIRTSVDHGTAYDIAGQGIADQSSLVAAVKMAAEMAKRRKQSTGSPADQSE
jgi:4-hydroxythreonine-4-phosphate dehydrogenase